MTAMEGAPRAETGGCRRQPGDGPERHELGVDAINGAPHSLVPYRDVLVGGNAYHKITRESGGKIIRLERVDPRDVEPIPASSERDTWLVLAIALVAIAAVIMAASLLLPWW